VGGDLVQELLDGGGDRCGSDRLEHVEIVVRTGDLRVPDAVARCAAHALGEGADLVRRDQKVVISVNEQQVRHVPSRGQLAVVPVSSDDCADPLLAIQDCLDSQVRTGGTAREHEPRWIRSKLAGMLPCPPDREPDVGNLVLELNMWLQTVVGADADEPATTDQVADQR
jgi:hypothetical protein